MILVDKYENKEKKFLVEEFINNQHKNKYVLGRNKWALSIISILKIDGIIDDFTTESRFENLPVYKMVDIQDEDCIVLSATMGAPKTAKNKLNNLGILNVDYFAFYKYSKLNIIAPPFIDDFEEDFSKNRVDYENVYGLLSDYKSKKTFENILNFKITLDLEFMKDYENTPKIQYFENDIYKMSESAVFVDGGGYIGDTTLNFIEKNSEYKKIYLFEPMMENMKKAKQNLAIYDDIEYFQCGLSNFEGEVFFSEDDASSSIVDKSNIKIKVNYLDNLIKEKVDFIKFDIEGAEQDAIDGAKELIKKYNPILAICIYHKAHDWYKIPQKILEINKDYKIYLRHYMEGISETVMYFIPLDKTRS